VGKLLEYARIFRWQTAPATICLVLTGFLAAGGNPALAPLLGLYAWVLHGAIFGHNSLMDTAMGYDRRDPSKRHHPLVAGRVGLEEAHRVIHWLLGALALLGVALTLWASPDPAPALACLVGFAAFGHAYNDGLSKVDPLGSPLSISACFASLGAWAWFMGSGSLGALGWALVGYFFLTILFQISWSGFIKELGIRERSNLLLRLGARVENGVFQPGRARYYGWAVKLANLSLGAALLRLVFSWQGLVSLLFFGALAVCFLHQLTKPRPYVRERELMRMSLEEIATIYLPILIVVPPAPALVLEAFGICYFFAVNKALWSVPYPRV